MLLNSKISGVILSNDRATKGTSFRIYVKTHATPKRSKPQRYAVDQRKCTRKRIEMLETTGEFTRSPTPDGRLPS